MEFRLLGPLEASVDGVPVRLAAPKQQSLLALLLLEANTTVCALGRDRIVSRGTGYVLDAVPGEIDLARFGRLVENARAELAAGDPGAATGLLDGSQVCANQVSSGLGSGETRDPQAATSL
jgi:hypothetical protein